MIVKAAVLSIRIYTGIYIYIYLGWVLLDTNKSKEGIIPGYALSGHELTCLYQKGRGHNNYKRSSILSVNIFTLPSR
jgi:hypothetical protein